jgi:hypothetical protein
VAPRLTSVSATEGTCQLAVARATD